MVKIRIRSICRWNYYCCCCIWAAHNNKGLLQASYLSGRYDNNAVWTICTLYFWHQRMKAFHNWNGIWQCFTCRKETILQFFTYKIFQRKPTRLTCCKRASSNLFLLKNRIIINRGKENRVQAFGQWYEAVGHY